jgi:enoyl-CoA hydratase
MAAEDAVLRQDQNGIARIVLNRPETLNAMNMDLLQRLSTTLEEVRSDHAVKAVIITGAGNDAFSAGADIKFVVQL